jgi:hypothetical protein
MELLSYGNQISSGKYKLHSKFTSAVNFVLRDSFVFVVNENIGSGPLNIVVKGILPIEVKSLDIIDRYIYINETKLCIDNDLLYDPSICLKEFDYNNIVKNLDVLENTVIKMSPPNSLAFVFETGKRSEFTSGVEVEYVKRVDTCVKEILFGNILTGVKNIKGLGPGLTPAGDDFNCGILIALNLIEKISKENLSQSIKMVFEEAVGSNLFTNSFLMCASQGLLFNKFRELVNAVIYSNENTVIEKTNSVLSVGQTSGADQTVGFLIGMKRFLL